MHKMDIRKAVFFAGGFLGIWLFARYLLPVCLPFLMGLLLALAAEPAVGQLSRRLQRRP